jgi:hypothetical protein
MGNVIKIRGVRCNDKSGCLEWFAEGAASVAAGAQFTKVAIDEAQCVFAPLDVKSKTFHDVVQEILKKNPKCELTLLSSDASQAPVSLNGNDWPSHLKLLELSEVCRSRPRIVVGALAFQLGDQELIGCVHKSQGPPLRPFLFDGEGGQAEESEQHAKEVVNAIAELLEEFPGLELHNRLAVIVPNEHFRVLFCDSLERELKGRSDPKQALSVVSALDASKTLPDPKRNRGKSSIVVDAIDEMNGLKRLVAFGVGLDEEISGNATLSREVRSGIYRAITRAHLVHC